MLSDLTDYEGKQTTSDGKQKATSKNQCAVPFEDFSDEAATDTVVSQDAQGRGLDLFYEALEGRETSGRPVRIAFFGDSFVEGDIMTSDVRAMLQQQYGGCGAGYVDIENPVWGMRETVRARSNGWRAYSLLQEDKVDRHLQGIDGRCYICSGNAWFQMKGVKDRASEHLDSADVSTIYFMDRRELLVKADVNEEPCEKIVRKTYGPIGTCTVTQRMGRIRWNVGAGGQKAVFYGASMEGKKGVTLDNFSTRSFDGIALGDIPKDLLRGFAEARPYDMLVFEFGLNVATKSKTDYTQYTDQLKRVIAKYAEAYPKATIVIVGVAEIGRKKNGQITTMDGIKELHRDQRKMARDMRCVFWSLYEAEQTLGGVAQMSDGKPHLANRDYTHVNNDGGKALAKCFVDAITTGYDKWQKDKK